MKLLKLTLRNFKGVKAFDFNPDGQNADIYGANASGKTTIMDAFLWLLFDKDSQGRAVFEVKTLKDGEPLHNLEHEVSATLELPERQVHLRKVYQEKWTKKRGSASAEFTGHTSKYFIDDVPTSKTEFQEFINSIAPEETFKLVTDPRYFNERLHWQKRREILFREFGELTDLEIIQSNHDLAALPEILNGRSIEDYRKIVTARRSVINTELKNIPVRIDEVMRSLPDISQLNKKTLTESLENLNNTLTEAMAKKSRIKAGGEVAELKKRLSLLESEIINKKNAAASEIQIQVEKRQRALSALTQKRSQSLRVSDGLEDDISRINRRIADREALLTAQREDLNRLRGQWKELSAKIPPEISVDTVCPTCGQILPAEQVQQARDKALLDFNQEKAGLLKRNKKQGQATAAKIKEFEAEIKELKTQLPVLMAKKTDIDAEDARLQTEIERQSSIQVEPVSIQVETPKEIVDLKAKIKELETGNVAPLEAINSEIAFLESSKAETNRLLQVIATHDVATDRLRELEVQQKALAEEFEQREYELDLLDKFIQIQADLLEKKINNQFQIAKFKLFDIQVNGGINEVCECLYKGVPYSSMNNAARINCGLDIINTLSWINNFSAPIFIDNAEAVTDLLPVPAQVVRLIVSKKNKKLKIVTNTPETAEKNGII